jgi:hypothetical protein
VTVTILRKRFKGKSGQAAIELAVFGAILIFVLGVIIRSALNASYLQNQNLKAMRMAMSTSFRHSEGLAGGGGGAGDASRNSASVLIVEDRLTANSAKYGAIDRTPFIFSGSATHSRNLFLPVDADEDFNMPVFDVFVNGIHFPFSTAKFKRVCLAETEGECGVKDVDYDEFAPVTWDPLCATQCPTSVALRPQGCPACPEEQLPGCPTCVMCPAGPPGPPCTVPSPTCPPASCPVCESPSAVGCARLYSRVPNHPLIEKWCDHDGGALVNQCPVNNISADERFDLDRSGGPDVPGTQGTPRSEFSWQWFAVMAFDETRDAKKTFLNFAEGLTTSDNSQNLEVDIDGDIKTERIMEYSEVLPAGVITKVIVMDFQEGDMDFSINDGDTKPRPGFTRDVEMRTYTREGTYLLIDEGKLFNDNRQYIRTAQKQDQIDIIMRFFQLSNDTGRFCYNGVPTDWENPPVNPITGRPVVSGVEGLKNPVEACNNCFTTANMSKTCMFTGDLANLDENGNLNPRHPMIYVRSRIENRRGRKWVTDRGGDTNIDFGTPPVP